MPIQISPKRHIKGLYSNPNHSSGIPEGGLLRADNCVVDRPGLLSKRKGFNRYGTEKTGPVTSLMDYNGSLVVHSGLDLGCDVDGDGTLTSWGGIYDSPSSLHAIRAVALKKNLYFTSRDGVYRNESLASTPALGGMPEGLDVGLTKYGTGAGWFLHNQQVGYRVVWEREDANEAVLVGEPSYRYVIKNKGADVTITHDGAGNAVVTHADHGFANDDVVTIYNINAAAQPAGATYEGPGKTISVIDDDTYSFSFSTELFEDADIKDESGAVVTEASDNIFDASAGKDYYVQLKFTVPDGIVSGDKYEIFRTLLSGDVVVDPGVDLMGVAKKEVTADELTAGTVEFSDTVWDVSLGDYLYTNPGQETISQRNTRPPRANDIVEFRGHMFAADLTYKSEKEIHLDEIKDISNGDSISIEADGSTLTYKFSAEEAIAGREFQLFTTEATTEENIEETAHSLVRTINRDPNNTLIYAHYASGELDPSGKVLIRARRINIDGFFLIASSAAVGDSFKEEIPTSGEAFKSGEDNIPNGLAYSKVLEPDAMPKANVIYVGSKNEPIQRIFGLKTSLIILKGDGVFRLSGNTPSTFVLEDLDPAIRFFAPNAAAVLNDSVYCLSTQGILRIGDNGTNIVSFPIDDQVKNIPSYMGYEKHSFIVTNEENKRLVVFTQKTSGDMGAKIGWVYNYLTQGWTTWTKDVTCGASLRGKREMYLGSGADRYVLKERVGTAARNSGDYMDEDIPVVNVAGGSVVLNADGKQVSQIEFYYGAAGEYYYQGKYPLRAGFMLKVVKASADDYQAKLTWSSKIASFTTYPGSINQFTVQLEDNIGSIPYTASCSVSLPIDSVVEWAPNGIGLSELPKQFTYAIITMESGTTLTNELGFYSDAVPAAEWVGGIKLDTPGGWGRRAWGTSGWGDEDTTAVVPLISAVPRQHQRCRELTVMFRHRVANEEFDIESIALRYKMYKGKLVRTPE